MIYTLKGILRDIKEKAVVVEVGGIGLRVFVAEHVFHKLPSLGERVELFTYLRVREDEMSLYGFWEEKDLEIFELLNSISGIGPKSALNILSVAPREKLLAAIKEGRAELLTKVSGIGKKTAERIILELREKVTLVGSEKIVGTISLDMDIEEALMGLGYGRAEVREALKKVPEGDSKLEERLKAALKTLKK